MKAAVEDRRASVQARNEVDTADRQLPFALTREQLDSVEEMWEPPVDAELTDLNDMRAAEDGRRA